MRDNEGFGLVIAISTVVLINFIKTLLSFFKWIKLKIQHRRTQAKLTNLTKVRKYMENKRK